MVHNIGIGSWEVQVCITSRSPQKKKKKNPFPLVLQKQSHENLEKTFFFFSQSLPDVRRPPTEQICYRIQYIAANRCMNRNATCNCSASHGYVAPASLSHRHRVVTYSFFILVELTATAMVQQPWSWRKWYRTHLGAVDRSK
jgi:hypothetical protein